MTPLDPSIALLVIDLQQATLGNPAIQPVEDIVGKARMLAATFRERGLPVVLASVTGTPPGRNAVGGARGEWPAAMSTLVIEAEPDDILVPRATWSAFAGTGLAELLPGVTQVVIAGVATSFGVESTARDAYDRGYNVVVVSDAVKDLRPEAHAHSLEKVFPMLGEVVTAAELVSSLERV